MRILYLVALAVLSGCASQGPVQENAQATKAQGTKAGGVATPAALVDTKTDKFRVPAGYRKRDNDGLTVYCRKETILGSRFPQEFCFSQAQLEDLEANSAAQRREMQRGQICGAKTGLCGE